MGSMLGKVTKCRVNPAAANAFRNSGPVASDIESRARAIAADAQAKTHESGQAFRNPGYAVRTERGKTRCHGLVIAANPHTMSDNRKNNTLLKSIDAGR